ncbi:nuclease-related domain-containing protein [Macrococcus brunensis]|uniref:nuclease-related domain-containing protein n=1 Tax=Macrococcus brunensis TaxID=198483 RepID=UPI001EF013CB|nr:nuclease-related domain-containing protein [Macrococcus brunensis]ULG72088.1 NERD domain-containing protein [Macrococcus brunensis]
MDEYDDRVLRNYVKGLDGEQLFYEMTQSLSCLQLWDVSVEMKGSVQFDFLFISDGRIYHFEIKNFSGNYSFMHGNLVSEHGYVYKDVLPQLMRADYKLKELVRSTRYEVISRVVFINPSFRVEGWRGHSNVLFHHQLDGVIDYFKNSEVTPEDYELAAYLIKQHRTHNKYQRIKYYPVTEMKKEMRCPKCRKLSLCHVKNMHYTSCYCGYTEKLDSTIFRVIDELEILKVGPLKITTLVEWTGLNRKTIERFMQKYCERQEKYCYSLKNVVKTKESTTFLPEIT